MKCPKCKRTEAAIVSNEIVVTGDNSPDEETKAYRVMKLACRDPQCPYYGKIVATVRHSIQLGKDEVEET